jgi:hypothetical protein
MMPFALDGWRSRARLVTTHTLGFAHLRSTMGKHEALSAARSDGLSRSATTLNGALDLLDHLIRSLEERRRDRQAKRLGGFEVDQEFELGGLFDGKVGGLGAF